MSATVFISTNRAITVHLWAEMAALESINYTATTYRFFKVACLFAYRRLKSGCIISVAQ